MHVCSVVRAIRSHCVLSCEIMIMNMTNPISVLINSGVTTCMATEKIYMKVYTVYSYMIFL